MGVVKELLYKVVDRQRKTSQLLNKFEAWEERAKDVLCLRDKVNILDKKVDVLDGKLDMILNFMPKPKKSTSRGGRPRVEYACKS